MSNNFKMVLMPPGHRLGHPRLYAWEVSSDMEVHISGTSDDLSDAADMATSALQGVMKEAEASDERKD